MRYLILAGLLMAVATAFAMVQPLPPNAEVPRLVGRWEGIWSGTLSHPMILNVLEQTGPKITGTVTYLPGGGFQRNVTDPMTGTVGMKDGKMVLVINVGPAAGTTDDFEFAFAGSNKLEGYGAGRSMVHRGPVTLTRQ